MFLGWFPVWNLTSCSAMNTGVWALFMSVMLIFWSWLAFQSTTGAEGTRKPCCIGQCKPHVFEQRCFSVNPPLIFWGAALDFSSLSAEKNFCDRNTPLYFSGPWCHKPYRKERIQTWGVTTAELWKGTGWQGAGKSFLGGFFGHTYLSFMLLTCNFICLPALISCLHASCSRVYVSVHLQPCWYLVTQQN